MPPDADRPRIEYVEWVDSAGTHGWCTQDDVDHAREVMVIRSTGFVAQESDAALVLALSNGYGPRCARPFGELMSIPKVAITKRVRLA